MKSVGKDGVTTDDIPKSQIAESKTKAVDDLMKLGNSMLLKEVETAILTDLEHSQVGWVLEPTRNDLCNILRVGHK